MVAEDEAINRLYITTFLKKHKFNVVEAGNGEEVLKLFSEDDFDCIIMDISMPKVNGLDAAREIRKREQATSKHIPIPALTAHAFPEYMKQCRDAGMDDYLTKPVNETELIKKIAMVTGSI